MEQTLQSPQVYDFRQHDRIWQRVAPQLEPFPELRQQPAALAAMGEPAPQTMAPTSPAQLPGADPNPCCMGSAAAEILGVLTGFVEESLSDRHQLLTLSRHAPPKQQPVPNLKPCILIAVKRGMDILSRSGCRAYCLPAQKRNH